MSMYPWKAGEIITAHKLRAGVQYGVAPVSFTEDDEQSTQLFNVNYHRGSTTVEFDVPFASPPTIQVTPRSTVPGDPLIEASYSSVTTTGFTIYVARRTDTTTNVDWLAIGVPE